MIIKKAFESYFSGFTEFNEKGNDTRTNIVAALKIAACMTVLLGFSILFVFAHEVISLYGRVTAISDEDLLNKVLEKAQNQPGLDMALIKQAIDDFKEYHSNSETPESIKNHQIIYLANVTESLGRLQYASIAFLRNELEIPDYQRPPEDYSDSE